MQKLFFHCDWEDGSGGDDGGGDDEKGKREEKLKKVMKRVELQLPRPFLNK